MKNILYFLLFVIVGCRTINEEGLSVGRKCEIHQQTMTIETLPLTAGYPGYVQEYYRHMQENFPHYHGVRWDHLSYQVGVRYICANVCLECTKQYHLYWKIHKSLRPENEN